jgi:hypothetical protein
MFNQQLLGFKFSPKIFLWLVLILSICARLYWIPQKEGLFLDESASIILSECKELGLKKYFDENKTYNGSDIKKISWGTSSSFSDALSDIKELSKDNKDPPHTNLYYSALRLCLVGADGNLRDIINRACYLNIFFWLFSFFFLYKLLKRLFDDDLVIALTLLIASVSAASLSTAIFIRPYGLQEALFVALTYVFTRIYQSIENQTRKYCWKDAIQLSILLSFVLLSGYLAITYVLALIGVLTIVSWRKNEKKDIALLTSSFVLSLILANVLYQKYLSGFSSGNQVTAGCFNVLLDYKSFLIRSLNSTGKALEAIFVHLLLPFVIISFLSFRKLRFKAFAKNDRIAIVILACGTLWAFSSFAVVPYRDYRYIAPVFPMFTLIVPIIADRIYALKARKIIVALASLAHIAIAFNPIEPNGFLIKQRIRYLFRNKDHYVFNGKPEVPALFYCNTEQWRIIEAIAFLNDRQKYQFVNSYDSFVKQLSKYDRAFVIIENSQEICSEFKIPDEYEVVSSPDFKDKSFIAGYEIAKKKLSAFK